MRKLRGKTSRKIAHPKSRRASPEMQSFLIPLIIVPLLSGLHVKAWDDTATLLTSAGNVSLTNGLELSWTLANGSFAFKAELQQLAW